METTIRKPDNDFSREIVCTYKEERYSVRDNGAVLKHCRESKRPRPTDNQWTFGKANDFTGYMEIVSVRVHIIVATAFHGERSTKVYVVDHIDTNRRNNRPENLRWVTRLENAMSNPVTRKKIEFVCGCSVEEFLSNPKKYRDRFQEQNFGWMRTVSEEEAKACLENMTAWAKSDKLPSGGTLGEWVYNPILQEPNIEPVPEIIQSKTLNAVQCNWRVPSEFPCCPQEYIGGAIAAYAAKLKTGATFCRNEVYSSLVSKSALTSDGLSLYVMTQSGELDNAVKGWALAKVTYEDDLFVHTSLGNFFTEEGAEKQFCLAQGLEWTGGDSIDDYC
ncbi:MAG: HNH endonuclease [Cyclobacteriaceae bacterium]|nr:HNH endonuclease [Cyclobacteriaceae bacterium]